MKITIKFIKNFLLIFFVFYFIISNEILLAQSNADTLEIAKHLNNNKKYIKAFSLLEKYQVNHPNDLNTVWLCAQTAYLMKHFKTSEKEYEKAVKIDPHNAYLLLDYYLMIVNSGDLEKAKPLLRTYYSWYPANTEVLIALAKISLWQGDYISADWFIKKTLEYEPKNKMALSLQDEIISAKSPWGKISIAHTSDDQPLYTTVPAFEGGLYKNALFFLHFNFQTPTFVSDNKTTNALWLRTDNKSVISKKNMDINIGLGLLKFPSSKNVSVTGNFQINKTIINHLIFSALAERKPYFYSLSSLDNVVTDDHYSLLAAWNNPDKWNGKTAFDLDYFNDKNYISSFSAWVITPPLNISIVKFNIGYGFNYSTSKENRFNAIKTLSEIIDSTNSNSVIKGFYNPYFTPNKQYINSVIASFSIHPSKTLDFAVKTSYGFSASTKCPYLYINKNAGDSLYITRGYFNKKYFPFELVINAVWKLTKKIGLNAEYIYNKTNFYKNNYLVLGIKMSFWNENK